MPRSAIETGAVNQVLRPEEMPAVLKRYAALPFVRSATIEEALTDESADGLQALLQGRGVGYAHDLAVIKGIAQKNPQVRRLDELYQLGFRGAAVRKGEKEWLAYVNASIKRAKAEGLIVKWIKQYDQPDLVETTIQSWDLSQVPPKAR